MLILTDQIKPFPRQLTNADDVRSPWDAYTSVGGLPESQRQVIDPTQMDGVIEVWSPDQPGLIALEDGDRVLSWTPLTDGNNTVIAGSGSTERPTFVPKAFSGLYPGIRFDGVGNVLTGTNPSPLWEANLTVVFTAQSTTTSGVAFEYTNDGFVSTADSFAVAAGSGITNAYIGIPEKGFYLQDGLTTARVVSMRVTRATSTFLFRVNGADVGATMGATPPAHTPGGTTTFSFGGSQSGPMFWGGTLGRIAFFNRVLTPAETLDVERWAALGIGVAF